MKLFNDLHYLPMPRIVLLLCIILPLYHFAPPPPPWKLFNDLCYLPMSRIILPPGFILPSPPFILPPGNLLMYTIFQFPYHFAPISFCPLSFCPPPPPPPWKLFHDLHYLPMSSIILPPALDFVFILIKSPFQQKLMTGAHLVTVAPLVPS